MQIKALALITLRRLLMMNEILTLTEATKLLRMSRQTVVKHLESGTIPGWKIGKEWRVSRTEIEKKLRGENK